MISGRLSIQIIRVYGIGINRLGTIIRRLMLNFSLGSWNWTRLMVVQSYGYYYYRFCILEKL